MVAETEEQQSEAAAESTSATATPAQAGTSGSQTAWPEKTVPGPAKITARTVLDEPKVTLFTNFLSEAECAHLLSLAEGRWERSTVTRGYASTLLDGAVKQSEGNEPAGAPADDAGNAGPVADEAAATAAGSATAAESPEEADATAEEAQASSATSAEQAAEKKPEESNGQEGRATSALHVEPDQGEEKVVGKSDASVVPQKGGVLQVESKNRTSHSVIFQYGESPVLEQILARVAMVTKLPLENVERPVLVRYEPGQFFNEHHDGAIRPKTVFAYFNDVEGGGETKFPHLGFQVRPVAGSALMWPNVTEDGSADMRMIHQGLPPEKGVKYGINLFVNAHSQRDASHIRMVQKTA